MKMMQILQLFVDVNTIIPKVFVQKNSWECGHQVVLNFKTYL
jgi:hypothetical protein